MIEGSNAEAWTAGSGQRLGCRCPFLGGEPLGDFQFAIANEFFHLLDLNSVVALFVFSKQKQIGFVLRSVAVKEPLVLGLDRRAKL